MAELLVEIGFEEMPAGWLPGLAEQLKSRFAEAAMLLDELARIDLGSHVEGFPLPLAVLEGLSEPRARNVLRHVLARRGVRIPCEARLIEALRQLLAAAPDRHPCIVLGDWQLRRRRGNIELEAA